MSSFAISLLGRDYPDLGPLAVVHALEGGALALSRGREPKAYAHTDPNEDGALLVRTPDGVVLAVADGYNGSAASERSLDAVRDAAPELMVEDDEAFERAGAELARSIAASLGRVAPSRSWLLVAALRAGRCHFASFGDSALFRAGARGRLNVINELALRPSLAGRKLLTPLWCGAFERAPGERIAIVSDGVTNFMQDPASLPRLLADAADDAAAARSIAEAALGGGAGDNVAVAVFGADLG